MIDSIEYGSGNIVQKLPIAKWELVYQVTEIKQVVALMDTMP